MLARAGFICIAFEHEELGPLLIPELQSAYAVLDWDDVHLSRTLRRWLRSVRCRDAGYSLAIGHDLHEILAGIARAHGEGNWLNGRYAALLHELSGARTDADDFELMTAALVSGSTGQLVAGEVGYRVGQIYTSLTGFIDRDGPPNSHTGTLQLALLADHLKAEGFAFWNLGHPGLAYKQALGARVLERGPFLVRWFSESGIG